MTDLLPLLQEFYRDKLSAVLRHTAVARSVSQYDANNTYQYIINREETELSWVGQAIADLGGDVPVAGPEPDLGAADTGADASQAIIAEDARDAQTFVDRWRPQIRRAHV